MKRANIFKTSVVVGLSTLAFKVVLAQEPIPAIQSQVSTTADEICIMSNGNRIPCSFIDDAEKDVVSGGKVVDQVSGKEYCKNNDRYVSCGAIKADGSVTLKSRLEQYINIVIFILAKYWLYILITLGIALISIVVSRKLSKK
jgi:hypothetical protein